MIFMVKPQSFRGKVADHILFNDKFQYLHIELTEPNQIEFTAGQYISVAIGGGERRSYSIASEPQLNHAVQLCVDVTPQGKGATFLKNLRPGDEVEFLAPLGRFVVESEAKLLFVATGSGITPIRSMLLDLLQYKKDPREMRLLWGVRQVNELFWLEHFRKLHDLYENFTFMPILSKPPERWPIVSGHVTGEVETLSLDSSWGTYLCGNNLMIEEVCQVAAKKGVPKEQLHFEKFF
ncbi:MAG: FAD-binding oxidoreductase [Patescibacteria group bacterium]|nr:hypothetical protein [Patescibacteria group bacterium]MDP4030829.1 FAD-binding oxidoreductase [Candidatus Beckwithbacteria bacterium]MDZ4228723.1 FAD-binding oxidoreductase [Patescibacteria group bacterium]